jgi:glutathione S-transferase
MLRELDAPHEKIIVDFASGELGSPEFRAINPMGKLPALVDDGVVVTESAAICAYLADKFPEKGLAPPAGSTERGSYYRYLFFPGVTLEPLLALTALGVEYDAVSIGCGDIERGMAAVESMTPATGWALGEQFTAADVVFGGTLSFFTGFDMMKATSAVAAYVERIQARPAYQESHSAI